MIYINIDIDSLPPPKEEIRKITVNNNYLWSKLRKSIYKLDPYNYEEERTSEIFAYVVLQNAKEYRVYHNLGHIINCINCLDLYCNSNKIEEEDYNLLIIAIFFHDVVMKEPHHIHSYNYYYKLLGYIFEENYPKYNEIIRNLIWSTSEEGRSYIKSSILPDGRIPLINDIYKIMADIDFSILGFPPIYYNSYIENIEKEFLLTTNIRTYLYSSMKFVNDRIKEISKDQLYFTQWFKKYFGSQAVINLHNTKIDLETKMFLE